MKAFLIYNLISVIVSVFLVGTINTMKWKDKVINFICSWIILLGICLFIDLIIGWIK